MVWWEEERQRRAASSVTRPSPMARRMLASHAVDRQLQGVVVVVMGSVPRRPSASAICAGTPSSGSSGSRLNMLERFHRAATAPTVELAIQLIISPDDYIDDEAEAEELAGAADLELPNPPTPTHAQILAGAGEILTPCAFTGSLTLPTAMLSNRSTAPSAAAASRREHLEQSPAAAPAASSTRPRPGYLLSLQGTLPAVRLHIWPDAVKRGMELAAFGTKTASALVKTLRCRVSPKDVYLSAVTPPPPPPPSPQQHSKLSHISVQVHLPLFGVPCASPTRQACPTRGSNAHQNHEPHRMLRY